MTSAFSVRVHLGKKLFVQRNEQPNLESEKEAWRGRLSLQAASDRTVRYRIFRWLMTPLRWLKFDSGGVTCALSLTPLCRPSR